MARKTVSLISAALFAVLLSLAACSQPARAVAPLRGVWLKELLPGDAGTSANPSLRWWQRDHHHGSGSTAASPECMWDDFPQHDAIKAWEFQGQPHRHMIRNRDKAVHQIESILRKLSSERNSGVMLVEGSRTMAIFREVAFEVTTRHGHPLKPKSKEEKHSQPFPWKGLAYLRLRQYKLLWPAGAYVPSSMPGTADLTLKMKNIQPDTGVGELSLPQQVGSAKLTAKMEYDGHCDHGRITMSPLYRPVDQGLNVSRIANVKQWYPNLATVARLDEQEPLMFLHDVHRAKVVWTVLFNGVIGEANLVIKYNTTFNDAVAGNKPKNGEISLRIRRDVAEATGTTGQEGKEKLMQALHTIARAMQVFREHEWDGKTPALPDTPDCNGCGCGCKCGCDCKHCGDTAAAGADNKCGCGCKCGCDCKHCGKELQQHGSKVAADADNKCGCGCKCSCDCKHCGKELQQHGSKAAADADNKCGCGCKCGCDCKHCGKELQQQGSKAAADADNKRGCGCKCGCDCKHCGDTAAANADNKCGCGCKCGCDCKHCDKELQQQGSKAAADADNKCGCGCKCGCDCKHCGDTAAANADNKCGCGCKHCKGAAAPAAVALRQSVPRPSRWWHINRRTIRLGDAEPTAFW